MRWHASLSFLVAATVWEIVVRMLPDGTRTYVATGIEAMALLPALLESGLFRHMVWTTVHTFQGLLLCIVVGVPFGTLIGLSRRVRIVALPLIDAVRPLPSAALVPIFVVMPGMGLSNWTTIAVVSFGGVWPILINTATGIANLNQTAREAIALIKVSRARRLVSYVVPAAGVHIAAGVRLSVAICLILAVTSEMLIGGEGLGSFLNNLQDAARFHALYAIVIVIAGMGWLFNVTVERLNQLIPALRGSFSID